MIIFPVYYEVPKTPTDMVINSVGLLSKNLFKVQDTIAETAELLSPRSSQPLALLYSVSHLQSWIIMKKCVFYYHTMKGCVNWYWRCPGTSSPT